MNWLYVTYALLIAAAIMAAVWLKREGDRNWRRHQRTATVRVQIFTPTAQFSAACLAASSSMTAMTKAAIDMQRSMAKVTASLTTTPSPPGGTESAEETPDA